MTTHQSEHAAAEAGAGREPPLRGDKFLNSLGTVAGVGAVLLFLNFGSLPVRLSLGQLIVTFVAISVTLEAVRWIRRGIRRQARSKLAGKIAEFGGGLYGTAAVATWAFLQATDLYAEIVEAGSLTAFLGSISLGWLISEAIEAMIFAFQALLWPWYWFSAHGFGTALTVAVGVWVFDAVAKRARRWWVVRGADPSVVAPSAETARSA